jgi:hypothetical protein
MRCQLRVGPCQRMDYVAVRFVDSGALGQDSLVEMRMSLGRCDETDGTVRCSWL